MSSFRSGVVALVGRPNAGKSTLLNALLGQKLAITSNKPQTTRDRIAGILSTDTFQAVLLDTPGLHEAWTELNKAMVQRSTDALAEADLVIWVEDTALLTHRKTVEGPLLDEVAELVLNHLVNAGKPVLFVANKIDKVPVTQALPLIAEVSQRLPLAAAIPMSALKKDGMQGLLDELQRHLPVGEAQHDPELWTQATERFLAAEIVREKIFQLTEQEIPYAAAVQIERFDESERESRRLVRVHAAILVERASQKGIVIGKGGDMIKRIGVAARRDLEELLDAQVHVELFVKVEPDWTRTLSGLRKAGYR